VSDLTPEKAGIKPNMDNWSTLEVICHLIDEECEDFRKHIEQASASPQPV